MPGENQDVPRSGARPAAPQLAHNSVRAASATSWRPTPPAPTGRPQKLVYSFFSSVASSDDDPACRNSNLDSGKTRCVACRYSQTPPLTFELPRGCVAWGLTTCLLRSSSYFNTRHSSANRCVGQTLTHSSDNPNTAEVTMPATYDIGYSQTDKKVHGKL